MLNNYPFYSSNKEEIKKFIFELLSCALCNGKYDDEKEVVEYLAKKFKTKKVVIEEMVDIINTILVINKRSKNLIFNERI